MFQVLRSSAGAGKTHALVKHYLGLCLRSEDPASYRKVLALTFTNKAATEMRERAVRYLRELSRNTVYDGALEDVHQHLRAITGLSQDALRERADRLLRHMLHHWSEVAISTIDAFTQRVVKPFAQELRLSYDLRMSTDQEGLLQRSVERLIALAGEDPRVTEILVQACLQLLSDEARWDPERPLLELSKELQNERSIVPLQRIGAMDVGMVARIGDVIRSEQRAFRDRVRAVGAEALTLLNKAELKAEHFFQTNRGIFGLFRKFAEFDGASIELNSYARTTLENGKWAGTRIDTGTASAIEAARPRLEELARSGLDLLASGYKDYLVRAAVQRDLPATFALHELEKQLETIKEEEGVAFFSDLTRKVAEVVAHEPVPFIHERMGERYHHFLIDEFQDTSVLQWTCLLPLIDNALSSGGSALLVGDAKQAIYRWRNGEVRLFAELPHLFNKDDDPITQEREATLVRTYHPLPALAHNRRSSPIIITFNNALFGELAQQLPPHLANIYTGHDQLPGKDRPGMVRLSQLSAAVKGEDRWNDLFSSIDVALSEALEDGARPGDVAILVRTSAQGSRIAQHLIRKGHSVLSPDGLKVTTDLRVGAVVEALRALLFNDGAAAMKAVQLRAMLLDRSTGPVDPLAGHLHEPDALAVLHAMLGPIDVHAPFDLLAELLQSVHRVLLPDEPIEAPFLGMLDEAQAWNIDHPGDLRSFLEHWDRNGAARGIAPPTNGDAVQVMTIHKAKGLEFPVVIVPDASMRARSRSTERIWVDPHDAVPALDAALVAYGSALVQNGVPELVMEEELRRLDELNLLYVAFTRAVDRLYAFVREDANDQTGAGLVAWMTAHGSSGNYCSGERVTLAQHAPQPAISTVEAAPLSPLVLVPRRRASLDDSPAMAKGRAMHAILARIRSTEDLDHALNAAIREGQLVEADRPELHATLFGTLQDPRLKPWLIGEGEVRNEATILDANGNAWRPDRVTISDGEVRVLDLKTGAQRPEHSDQVQRYVELLQGMGYPVVTGALYYISDDALVTL